ncbi:MAG: hypothetical protein GY851_12650 [bacterium]|nr:hypothetical protein [bacterium]
MHLRLLACLLLMSLAVPGTSLPVAPTRSLQDAAREAEPGLTYGQGEPSSPPKTLVFSATPDNIIAHAEEWQRLGIDGFFLNKVVREWSDDVWATDGKPWTIGESDETFQKTKQANAVCRELGMETFLKIAFDNHFEWFNDTAWQRIENNFRQFGVFARDSGCTGIALDIEYINEQYAFDWEGYSYDGYSRRDLVAQIRKRMTGAIQALFDEFPDVVLLTLPEQGLTLGAHIQAAWIEEAARRDAPGGVHCCSEYTYRNANIRYVLGHAWARTEVFHRLLSERGWDYWRERCSIAAGVWPFGFSQDKVYAPGMSVDEFSQAYAGSLMISRRYNWIYSHHGGDVIVGGGLEQYGGEAVFGDHLHAMARKDVVATPKLRALAEQVRHLRLGDYSKDLGVVPAMSFMGPHDLPLVRLIPASNRARQEIEDGWHVALDHLNGADLSLREHYGTRTHWMLLGPFPAASRLDGHDAVYPPEEGIDLHGEYDGAGGTIRWSEYRQAGQLASVDLTRVFDHTENVCAYALCYVTSPEERHVHLRIGTNDSGKLWIGDELVYDYPHEGAAFLDRDIVPVTLPKGPTPILIKISNGGKNWGFVFRVTDTDGHPASGLRFSVANPDHPE